ncbi:tafazzin [Cynara cardunculus var. scolymus]|uniref:tafazzin n=1 Tax=Cynara cardunculus var. scolymus TaxID=59895 RepID=UPI000D623A4B|nr:tafazzin [Cynara cardunculus var. scolymus]
MEERWFQKEDRWKDRALCVQHRLRDRFRVAIDKHRRRQRSNGYVSSVMERWLQRFRHFRSETLANSSTFYRKRVINGFDTPEDSVLTQMLQAVAVPIIGNVCHVFMHGLNHVQIYGGEKLQQAFNRPEKTPLITVSNHIASMDDPLVIAALLPSSVLLHARNLRWTLCASDRCFRNPVTSAFFKCVKVLPVSRGEGIYQKGMDVAITKLNRGGWVHIFPEGSRSRDGGKTMGSVKRGAARLILDADNAPMVVPFVHAGMQEIMPIGATFPRVGKMVTILVGDPIDFKDLRELEQDNNVPRGNLYDAVSSRISDRLMKLKAQVDKLVELRTDKQDVLMAEHFDTGYEEDNRYFRVGFSCQGSGRITMDPTELMGFAARGLFMNQRMKENVQPSKAWNSFWKQSHGSISMLACAN